MNPGRKVIDWDAGGCASGVYLVQADILGKISQTHKVLLVK